MQSSPRKENEVGSHGSSGAFQVYRRPAVPNNVPSAVPNPSATPEKKLPASANTLASTKGLGSVIEEHRRRGEALRKQQQLLTKHLFDIQVDSFLSWIVRDVISVFQIGGKKQLGAALAEAARKRRPLLTRLPLSLCRPGELISSGCQHSQSREGATPRRTPSAEAGSSHYGSYFVVFDYFKGR